MVCLVIHDTTQKSSNASTAPLLAMQRLEKTGTVMSIIGTLPKTQPDLGSASVWAPLAQPRRVCLGVLSSFYRPDLRLAFLRDL